MERSQKLIMRETGYSRFMIIQVSIGLYNLLREQYATIVFGESQE